MQNDQSKSEEVKGTTGQPLGQSQATNKGVKDMTKEELAVHLDSLTKELEDWKNRTLRIAADLQNTQNQFELDMATAKKSAKKSVAINIVSFINTMYLAFVYAPQNLDENTKNFINTLKSNFKKAIEDLKVSQIEIIIPDSGDDFNPETMSILNPEAVIDESSAKVKQVVSVGLKVDEQLIQPVSIMV